MQRQGQSFLYPHKVSIVVILKVTLRPCRVMRLLRTFTLSNCLSLLLFTATLIRYVIKTDIRILERHQLLLL